MPIPLAGDHDEARAIRRKARLNAFKCEKLLAAVQVRATGGGRLGLSANFGFIAKDTPLNGALQYQDDNANLKVHSSNGIDSLTFQGTCGSFTGNAKVNQQPGYRFRVTACDNGDPGPGQDSFSITVTGPNSFTYSNGGPITDGNIQFHSQ